MNLTFSYLRQIDQENYPYDRVSVGDEVFTQIRSMMFKKSIYEAPIRDPHDPAEHVFFRGRKWYLDSNLHPGKIQFLHLGVSGGAH